jgi:hypothetical protein
MGGGYSPGNYGYSHTVAVMYYDSAATPPSGTRPSGTPVGAYRYLYNGKRFRLGQLPGGDPVFTGGLTEPNDFANQG